MTNTTEDFKKISVSSLKKYGFLGNGPINQIGELYWERDDGIFFELSFNISLYEKTGYFSVYFTQIDNQTGNDNNLNYEIKLTSTECNFGGKRWWFLCPVTGKRCGVIYMQNNGYFASRKALKLYYEDQLKSSKARLLSFVVGANQYKAKEVLKTIKYPFRNGQPTRKYKRFMKLFKKTPTLEDRKKLMSLILRKKSYSFNEIYE